ncbi:hypothetical protein, partial [Paralcaligenes ureilyticus]|uniref:hypothetical protein n=1 Tax=Paralcaligenes ureilyticus TaxID=627131 RepID=UPI001A9FBA77
QRSGRYALRLPGSASSRRASGELAAPRTRGSTQTAPADTPRLPFVSTRRWPNDRTGPTPRPAAALMTCIGGYVAAGVKVHR